MIPLKYNIRNLWVRRITTLMTVLGTGLVVWSSCIVFGLVDGLHHSLKVSGDPLDLIVLRQGSTSEVNGGYDFVKAEQLAGLDAPLPYEVHVSAGPEQRLQIQVGRERYGSVDEVPDPRVRALIQAAVAEWERR